MPAYNKVHLIGNLTRDPKLHYSDSQTAICDFGLAIGEKWRGRDGELREHTVFVDCRIFDRAAEIFHQFMVKGKCVMVNGRLHYSTWEKDGQKRSRLRVTVEDYRFLSPRMTTPKQKKAEADVPSVPEIESGWVDSEEGEDPF